MAWTAQDWPIGAALIQFPGTTADGASVQDAGPEHWSRIFTEVRNAGFGHVDITDSWLRPGDLDAAGRDELARTITDARLGITAISVVRRSVIDPRVGDDNLAYALRTVEAAAAIGAPVVCLGLHRPLLPKQQAAEWFWTEPGDADPLDDDSAFDLAVERFREVGRAAAANGVDLSLELYEDTFLGTADSSLRLLDSIGLDNVGLNPDVGNIVRLHRPVEPWLEILEKTLPRANYWHVKNYFRAHDPATGAYLSFPAPLELGVVDYRRAIELALAAGFSGPICTEHYGGDGLSVSATNRRYLRDLIATKQEVAR
ncbi:sugar phosphate isomerase/epimerase [Knoellia remsis]|uniref:Sugar phosphate isomerase/epimerase n=1 Tax=Knoellia remsis TaxID=407159 RepID=A0A2T0UHZ8_9MICO|nr:sugar phosphate isomerase/epimerase family protein [Knoellia remsis]PRY57560.1 sugar phosphate isomerase/epimerase [Knoellia remsis]